MDLSALLDEPDPVGALVAVLERISDADRMAFARAARIPQRDRDEPRPTSEPAQRAERAFYDLHDNGSRSGNDLHFFFDPGGYGYYAQWLDVRDLIGEAATALAARDRDRVSLLAGYLRDLG